jgi:hypothetical protein
VKLNWLEAIDAGNMASIQPSGNPFRMRSAIDRGGDWRLACNGAA